MNKTNENDDDDNEEEKSFQHPGCAYLKKHFELTKKNITCETSQCKACKGIYVRTSTVYGFRTIEGKRYLGEYKTNSIQNCFPESPNYNYCTQICEDYYLRNTYKFRIGDRVRLQPHWVQPTLTKLMCLGEVSQGLVGELMEERDDNDVKKWVVEGNSSQSIYEESNLVLAREVDRNHEKAKDVSGCLSVKPPNSTTTTPSESESESESGGSNVIRIGTRVKLHSSYINAMLGPSCMGNIDDDLVGVVESRGVAGAGAKVWLVRCNDDRSPNVGLGSFQEKHLRVASPPTHDKEATADSTEEEKESAGYSKDVSSTSGFGQPFGQPVSTSGGFGSAGGGFGQPPASTGRFGVGVGQTPATTSGFGQPSASSGQSTTVEVRFCHPGCAARKPSATGQTCMACGGVFRYCFGSNAHRDPDSSVLSPGPCTQSTHLPESRNGGGFGQPPASSGGFGVGIGQTPATTSGFGQPFGQPVSTSGGFGSAGGGFGQPPASSGGFGVGIGQTPATTSGFGQPFGQPVSTSGGFGSAGGGFGQPPASSGGFGVGIGQTPAATSGFGQPSASSGQSTTVEARFSHPGCAARRPSATGQTCMACGGVFSYCYGSYGHRDSDSSVWSPGPCTQSTHLPESPNSLFCSQLCEDHVRGTSSTSVTTAGGFGQPFGPPAATSGGFGSHGGGFGQLPASSGGQTPATTSGFGQPFGQPVSTSGGFGSHGGGFGQPPASSGGSGVGVGQTPATTSGFGQPFGQPVSTTGGFGSSGGGFGQPPASSGGFGVGVGQTPVTGGFSSRKQNSYIPHSFVLTRKLLDIHQCRDRGLINDDEMENLRRDILRHFMV